MDITKLEFLVKLHNASDEYASGKKSKGSQIDSEELARACLKTVGLLHEKTTTERRLALVTVIFTEHFVRTNPARIPSVIYPALVLEQAWATYQAQ